MLKMKERKCEHGVASSSGLNVMTMPGSKKFLRLENPGYWETESRWAGEPGIGWPALRVGAVSFPGASQILLVLPDLAMLVRGRGRHQPHPPPHPGKHEQVQKVGGP